jgi:hypothetical protein
MNRTIRRDIAALRNALAAQQPAEDAGDEVLIFVPDNGRNSGVPLGRFGNVVIYDADANDQGTPFAASEGQQFGGDDQVERCRRGVRGTASRCRRANGPGETRADARRLGVQ